MKKKIAFLFGTRPEIIKLAPLINYCELNKIDYFLIHSGQHYSYKMDKVFIKNFGIKKPNYNLKIKSKSPTLQGQHTGKMLIKIEEVLVKEKPHLLFVHGDTNTAFAGAICAKKISTTSQMSNINIKIVHIESGLRSFDRKMPEEINRVICDHLADYLFVPTEFQKKNLIKESISSNKIYVVGNTISDSIKYAKNYVKHNYEPSLSIKKLIDKKYFILTLHRQESVDDPEILIKIIKGINKYLLEYKTQVYFFAHPRSVNIIKKNKIKLPRFISIFEPLDYFDFFYILKNSSLVLTDSGGLQEESSILGVPCVTLRTTTERPETIKSGSNEITGHFPNKIYQAMKNKIKAKNWKTPYKHTNVSEKIIKILLKNEYK